VESNMVEGGSVVRAYNALRYTAAAVGNHEFDYGPTGEAPTPRSAADDPRGALRQRAIEARFPLLAANILDGRTKRPPKSENISPSMTTTVAGVRVGISGVSTEDTLHATIAANVVGLEIAPLLEAIVKEASRLRKRGVDIVIVTAHAGGECHDFSDPHVLDS